MYFIGMSLVLSSILVSGCKKEEDDPIDSFLRSYSGVYMEEECGNGGPIQGTFTLESASLNIAKKTATSAEISCSHSSLGNLFTVQAVYESDTLLIIQPVTIEGRNFTGQFTYFKNGNGNRWVFLYDDEIECRVFGDPVSNVSFKAN